jgi:hypothetical protein
MTRNSQVNKQLVGIGGLALVGLLGASQVILRVCHFFRHSFG